MDNAPKGPEDGRFAAAHHIEAKRYFESISVKSVQPSPAFPQAFPQKLSKAVVQMFGMRPSGSPIDVSVNAQKSIVSDVTAGDVHGRMPEVRRNAYVPS